MLRCRDKQGNIIGVVGIGQDITGRLAQERKYTRLIGTANAPIFGVDTQGVSLKEFIRKEHQEKVQDVIDQTLHGELL